MRQQELLRQFSIATRAALGFTVFVLKQPGDEPSELAKQVGNKTECALLGFVQNLGKNYQTIRDDYPEESFTRVYTFNSVRKSMSTVIPIREGGYRLFTKGASEMILNKYVGFVV